MTHSEAMRDATGWASDWAAMADKLQDEIDDKLKQVAELEKERDEAIARYHAQVRPHASKEPQGKKQL